MQSYISTRYLKLALHNKCAVVASPVAMVGGWLRVKPKEKS